MVTFDGAQRTEREDRDHDAYARPRFQTRGGLFVYRRRGLAARRHSRDDVLASTDRTMRAAVQHRERRSRTIRNAGSRCARTALHHDERMRRVRPRIARSAARSPRALGVVDANRCSEIITALPQALRFAQRMFDSTGGLHAAARFDASGKLRAVREDVGRHDAFDTLIGNTLLEGRLPLAKAIMLASGRTSYELVQKAIAAGAPVLCAVSAPSSLAVALARDFGVTLIGFLRSRRFNVYAHAVRISE